MDAVNHIKLAVPRALAQISLRALIYAILFQRNMEAVEPQTFDALDAAVVCAPNETLDKEIRAKLEEFSQEYLETSAPRGELAVVFLQKRPRKGWFATTEELIPWELHLITLTFTPSPADRHASSSSASAARHTALSGAYGAGAAAEAQKAPSLVPALTQILMFCADKRHAVPPLGGADSGLSHQIMINPPPPTDLFSPSPSPPLPARSPPPVPSTTIATATLQARDTGAAGSSAAHELREARAGGDKDRPERVEPGRERSDRGQRRERGDRGNGGRGDGYERRGSGFTGTTSPASPPGGPGTTRGESSRATPSHGYTNPLRGYGYSGSAAPGHEYGHGHGHSQGQSRAAEHAYRDRDTSDGNPATEHHSYGQGQGGYLDAAKDGLRAVRAGAGAVAHWAGRGR